MLWYIIYMYVQVHVHVVHAYMYTTRNLTSSIGLADVHVILMYPLEYILYTLHKACPSLSVNYERVDKAVLLHTE